MISWFAKRKSGNGTIARQELYLLVNWPYVFIYKIGIGKDAKARARDKSRDHPGTYHCVAAARIEFAYQIEQLLLALTLPFFWPFFGGKEIRWGPLWLLLMPVYWLLILLRELVILALMLCASYLYWLAYQ